MEKNVEMAELCKRLSLFFTVSSADVKATIEALGTFYYTYVSMTWETAGIRQPFDSTWEEGYTKEIAHRMLT